MCVKLFLFKCVYIYKEAKVGDFFLNVRHHERDGYRCLLFLAVFQVVMAVAQLYWHLAPKTEVSIVTKSLVRLLRNHR